MLLARAHAPSGTSARVEMQRSNSPSLQGNEHRGKACPTNKECCFLVEPDSARIQMSLEGGAVNAQLAALLGEPPKSRSTLRCRLTCREDMAAASRTTF